MFPLEGSGSVLYPRLLISKLPGDNGGESQLPSAKGTLVLP